jgi:hypothetical protein
MKDARHYEAIVALLLDLPAGYKARIREFSSAECYDYALPLHLIHSFLMKAEAQPERVMDLSRLRERHSAELEAIREIVGASPLNTFLTLNADTAELRFADNISLDQRIELSGYLWSNTGGMA